MTRQVDEVIDFIRSLSSIPPVQRQVMIARLDREPTQAELDAAAAVVYPEDQR